MPVVSSTRYANAHRTRPVLTARCDGLPGLWQQGGIRLAARTVDPFVKTAETVAETVAKAVGKTVVSLKVWLPRAVLLCHLCQQVKSSML
jgi:hypothetical protein